MTGTHKLRTPGRGPKKKPRPALRTVPLNGEARFQLGQGRPRIVKVSMHLTRQLTGPLHCIARVGSPPKKDAAMTVSGALWPDQKYVASNEKLHVVADDRRTFQRRGSKTYCPIRHVSHAHTRYGIHPVPNTKCGSEGWLCNGGILVLVSLGRKQKPQPTQATATIEHPGMHIFDLGGSQMWGSGFWECSSAQGRAPGAMPKIIERRRCLTKGFGTANTPNQIYQRLKINGGVPGLGSVWNGMERSPIPKSRMLTVFVFVYKS